MTIYVEKSGADLAMGYTEMGGTSFATWSASPIGWATYFLRNTTPNTDNGLVFALGTTLTINTNSFWSEITFKTPSDFTGTNTLGRFGVLFYSGNDCTKHVVYAYQGARSPPEHFEYASTGGSHTDSGAFTLVANTTYVLRMIHDASAKTIAFTLLNSTKASTLDSTSIDTTSIAGSVTSIGMYAPSIASGTNKFTNQWFLTAIKCNSGTTEEVTLSTKENILKGTIEILPQGDTAWSDVSTLVQSVKIHKRFNCATECQINLFSNNNATYQRLSPNCDVRVKLGIDSVNPRYLFWGYIPPNPDYCNAVYIKGTDHYWKNDTAISLYGLCGTTIDPASSDYPEDDKDKESSEQEDCYKAQRYYLRHSNPFMPVKSTDSIVSINAYDYIAKLGQEYALYDDITNLDNMEVYSAISRVIKSMNSQDLLFAGSGSSPKIFAKDTKGKDWESLKDIIDSLVDTLDKPTDLPDQSRDYYYYQDNYGEPTFYPKVTQNTLVRPDVAYSLSDTAILNFHKDRLKYTIDIIGGYHLNLGDVIYISADDYDLRGYYIIPEITYNLTNNSCTTTLVLDRTINYNG